MTIQRDPDWILAVEVCGLLSLAAFAWTLYGSRSILLALMLMSLAIKRCRPGWPSTRPEVLSVWYFVTPLLYGISLFAPVVLTSYGVSWTGWDLTRFAFDESLSRLGMGVRNRGVSLAGPSGLDLFQFIAFSIVPRILGLGVIVIAVWALIRRGLPLSVPPMIIGAAACLMCLLAAKMVLAGDRLLIGWTIYFLSFYVSFISLPTHRAVTFFAINLTALLIVLPSDLNVDY